MRKICQCITLCNSGLTEFLLREDEAKTNCSGIINLLFGVLVDNMRRHFTHCYHFPCSCMARKNTMQLVKFLCILSKVCIFLIA